MSHELKAPFGQCWLKKQKMSPKNESYDAIKTVLWKLLFMSKISIKELLCSVVAAILYFVN